MSTKTEIVVCRASNRKVFSAIFRRVSFSTATSLITHRRVNEFYWLVSVPSFLAMSAQPVFDNLPTHGVYCTGEEKKEGIPQEEARPPVGGQEIPAWFSRLPNCHRGLLWAH